MKAKRNQNKIQRRVHGPNEYAFNFDVGHGATALYALALDPKSGWFTLRLAKSGGARWAPRGPWSFASSDAALGYAGEKTEEARELRRRACAGGFAERSGRLSDSTQDALAELGLEAELIEKTAYLVAELGGGTDYAPRGFTLPVKRFRRNTASLPQIGTWSSGTHYFGLELAGPVWDSGNGIVAWGVGEVVHGPSVWDPNGLVKGGRTGGPVYVQGLLAPGATAFDDDPELYSFTVPPGQVTWGDFVALLLRGLKAYPGPLNPSILAYARLPGARGSGVGEISLQWDHGRLIERGFKPSVSRANAGRPGPQRPLPPRYTPTAHIEAYLRGVMTLAEMGPDIKDRRSAKAELERRRKSMALRK